MVHLAHNHRFVICNNGFTIERYIHGWKARYNDIQQWNFGQLLPAFGAKPNQFKNFRIESKKDLESLFQDKEFAAAKYLQVNYPKRIEFMTGLSNSSLDRGTCYAPRGCACSAEADGGSICKKGIDHGCILLLSSSRVTKKDRYCTQVFWI
jgi:hypothetical protein